MKKNSLFNRQIDISTRSCLNSSGTTKDYSSIQKYLNSARNKDLMTTKRRAIDVTANDVSSDNTLEDNRVSDNTSIFTQKINPSRKTPDREISNSLQQEIAAKIGEGVKLNLVSPVSYHTETEKMFHPAPLTMTEYQKTYHANKFSKKDDSINMRIRGKSNNIELREGSLRKTLYQQNQQLSIKRKRKQQRRKLRELEQLERYR